MAEVVFPPAGVTTTWPYVYPPGMAEFDVDAMIRRYAERAQAVKERPLPPVAGAERQQFIDQAQADYTDFALVANANWSVEDQHLVLRIPLAGNG